MFLSAIFLLCAAAVWVTSLLSRPSVVFLQPESGALWLRLNQPFNPNEAFPPVTTVAFKTPVAIPDRFIGAEVQVVALRRVVVTIDGATLFDSGPQMERWKTVHRVPLPASLSPGLHTLIFVVSNRDGPSLIRVLCPTLHLRSETNWLARHESSDWAASASADQDWDVHLPPRFVSTRQAVRSLWPYLLCVFGFSALLLSRRASEANWANRIRVLLLAAWLILSINNIFKVPLEFGFDADEQMRFIQFVAGHHSLPRPDGGWQFFQAPLYYLLSGALDLLLGGVGVPAEKVPYLLRIIPLLCGAATIDWCYQAARLVFPGRLDLQAVSTTLGSLLPMNIYMSQAVSNEPLEAAIAGGIAIIGIVLMVRSEAVRSTRLLVLTGMAMGLAMLTKISAMLWFAPIGIAVVLALRQQKCSLKYYARATTIVTGMVLLIAGWWIVRNLRLIGRPFYLESSVAARDWWQLPGYRTPQMFFEFGRVFDRPIYNGLTSVWDSLFGTMWGDGLIAGQPGWNYRLMSCGLFLALVPMLLILTGAGRAIFPIQSDEIKTSLSLRFAAGVVGCFVLAILYVYLTLPIYSCAKASYMLGATPCISLLAAGGFDVLCRRRVPRIVIGSALICWAFTSYLTFFVL